MYLIDTYALIEWLVQGNDNYKKYFESMDKEGGFLTELTVLEFYYTVFHRLGKEKGDEALDIILGNNKVIDLTLGMIKEAAIFRSLMINKKKNLSYADSVNYVAAKTLKVKLLTGDNDFKNVENVEFVK